MTRDALRRRPLTAWLLCLALTVVVIGGVDAVMAQGRDASSGVGGQKAIGVQSVQVAER